MNSEREQTEGRAVPCPLKEFEQHPVQREKGKGGKGQVDTRIHGKAFSCGPMQRQPQGGPFPPARQGKSQFSDWSEGVFFATLPPRPGGYIRA